MRAHNPRIALTTVLAASILTAACSEEPQPREPSGPPTAAAGTPPATPAMDQAPGGPARAYSGPLPALPTPPYALPRPQPVVQAVYEFAARHPQVLRYVPCFCGCERQGHGHNADCFVSSRDADGRPHWDLHGLG